MTKKFFKTYYSLPDKHNRIDVVFERGYKHIQVLYNDVELATYASAAELKRTQILETPDESVIHIRFLKDTANFEVFFNAAQIDHSENTPAKAIPYLKWPVIACLAWYCFVVLFFVFRTNAPEVLWHKPKLLLTDPSVRYLLTSSLMTAAVLLTFLIRLQAGQLFYYYLALIATSIDAVYGILAPFTAPVMTGTRNDYTVVLILLPLAIKSVLIWVLITNRGLYKQHAFNKTTFKRKTNPGLVDN